MSDTVWKTISPQFCQKLFMSSFYIYFVFLYFNLFAPIDEWRTFLFKRNPLAAAITPAGLQGMAASVSDTKIIVSGRVLVNKS